MLSGSHKFFATECFTEEKSSLLFNPFQEIKSVFESFFPSDIVHLILKAGLQSPSAMLIKNRIFEINGCSVIDPSDFLIFF